MDDNQLVAIDMVLHCPYCCRQHIDRAYPSIGWKNPPHRTHMCNYCGTLFRPADVPTNGVLNTQTHGPHDFTRTSVDGVMLIAEERYRVREVECFGDAHDDQYVNGELEAAAECYLLARDQVPGTRPPISWPWDRAWWKPRTRLDNLIRAGQLVAAAIDRELRMQLRHTSDAEFSGESS